MYVLYVYHVNHYRQGLAPHLTSVKPSGPKNEDPSSPTRREIERLLSFFFPPKSTGPVAVWKRPTLRLELLH